MLLTKKTGGALLVAGLAAWAYYKYNKMSPEAKQKLTGDLKEKGRRWMDMVSPAIKDKFSQFKQGNSTVS